MNIISSRLPFANIYWYKHALQATYISFDTGERFEKMSFRNRYYIGTANGPLALSIPLASGRDQKVLMKDVRISYHEDWQKNHWRSIESAYKKTPFFEYYSEYIAPLFHAKTDLLSDWNKASYEIIVQLLRLSIPHTDSAFYIHAKDDQLDLRSMRPKNIDDQIQYKNYIQPFEIKNGFLPNLSILDLLFCEGPASVSYLRNL